MKTPWRRLMTFALAVAAATAAIPAARGGAQADRVALDPPEVVTGETLREWTFDTGPEGWTAWHDCRVEVKDGALVINATGEDPYLGVATAEDGPLLVIELRARSTASGPGQFFWSTNEHGVMAEERSRRFELVHDGEWRDYRVPIEVEGALTALRLDPGTGPGSIAVDRIAILRGKVYPLCIERLEAGPERVSVTLRNRGPEPLTVAHGNDEHRLVAGGSLVVAMASIGGAACGVVDLVFEPAGFLPLRRSVVVYQPSPAPRAITLNGGALTVEVAPDGSAAWIERDGAVAAVVAPLVLSEGRIPLLAVAEQTPRSVAFEGEGLRVTIAVAEDGEIAVSIRAPRSVEGPVLRALGSLEQGLFAGLEFLGKGERSSSDLDIETEDRLRFAPDPLKVTLPLMACLTERGAAAMTWTDMSLRPVFAAPNVLDAPADHRMALRGAAIDARILCRPAVLGDVILWAVGASGGLPPLPEPPRDRREQDALCLAALEGPLCTAEGWGHCAEPTWTRRFHADMASAIWRLTGRVPEMNGPLVPGGAHIANDAVYFVTGRAGEWLEERRREVRGLIAAQQADGGFVYEGPFRRGHFENTASGFCAERAARLLDFAWITGDRGALEAGVKALDSMRRFRTPRGAQTWELSLHTPDILAAAYLVRAYVRGFELTGNEAYREQAAQWALAGVPFVYLWDRCPIMRYATPPVYGATNYRAPLWIGLPVQWCGLVYAYSLALLAPHDDALDWNRLARGILIAGQQMQYPDGPLAGCLPDVFELPAQRRAGPSINPCALVSLDRALSGEVDSLAVAQGAGRRVAAPFAVAIRGREAHIDAREGIAYQILIDGHRIIDIISQGRDVVELE